MGKLLKDPSLFDNANATIAKANTLMADINSGKGALGKFASDPEFAKKLDNTMTKLSSIADKLDSDQGTAGLLLTDPKVYNNSDQIAGGNAHPDEGGARKSEEVPDHPLQGVLAGC